MCERKILEVMFLMKISCILETGAVFTFGKSQFADNIPNKFWIRDDKVIQVCCGDEHTALVAGNRCLCIFSLKLITRYPFLCELCIILLCL